MCHTNSNRCGDIIPHLLAEVAGVLEGASEDRLDEPFARQAAGAVP